MPSCRPGRETDGCSVKPFPRAMLLLALILAAINLRPGITSLAPLIERIAAELALCRSHLDIVGLALDQRMVLEVDGEDAAISLPPGILHAMRAGDKPFLALWVLPT